jgi:hypothetical protein
MKRLIKLIKTTPWSVTAAIVFLLAVFVTMLFIQTEIVLVFVFILAFAFSFIRVVYYFIDGV